MGREKTSRVERQKQNGNKTSINLIETPLH